MTATDGLEISFVPRWPYIGCVRKFVGSFFFLSLADRERAEQISMAASELLENAVKYGAEGDPLVKLAIRHESRAVDLRVENAATPAQAAALRREVALIAAADPQELYLRRMEESAATEGQSRLGLIRICAEGGARLALEVAEGRVSVKASFEVEES